MTFSMLPSESAVKPVLVVDDDEFTRDVIQDILAPHHDCAVFADAASLLSSPELAQAGCVVSDVCMDGMSGIELQDRLVEIYPWIPVLLVTGHAEVDMAVAAMKNGAFDFIQKPVVPAKLLERVASALEQGARLRQAAVASMMFQSRIKRLTEREIEVLHTLAAGLAAKEIARQLAISVRTVEHHRENIISKLEVGSLSGLIHFYAHWRLLENADQP